MNDEHVERAEGVLLGMACGDALGRPVEFKSSRQIADRHGELTEMVGDGTWNQPAGTISDDTEQALCIARSIAEQGRFDAADIAERFVAWYESGPFDVGNMTRNALIELLDGAAWDEAGRQIWEAAPEGQNAGNGSVMRTPPLAVAYHEYPAALYRTSRDASGITHADPRCTVGTAVLDLTIAAMFHGVSEPLATALALCEQDTETGMLEARGLTPVAGGGDRLLESGIPDDLHEALDVVPNDIDGSELKTSGYVVDTLQTALYDALTADSAEEAIVSAVNRGGDTDTIGAIAGAVAGARFTSRQLPDRWLETIDERDELEELAATLAAHPQRNR